MNSRVMPAELRAMARARRAPAADEADGIDLRALTRGIWRRRWLIAALAFGLGAALYFATAQMTPTYSARAKVMLDPRTAQISPSEQVVSELDLSEQVVNGEAAVVRSNVLLEEAVRRVGMDRLAPMDPDPERRLDDPEADAAARMRRLVWAVSDGLTVYRDGESYVLAIAVDSVDRQLAALLANTIAETYIADQIEGRRATTTRATAWLEERVLELRDQVEEAEAAVEQYRADRLVSDGGSLDTASQQLGDLNGQLIQARADRVTAEARLGQLEAVIERDGPAALGRIVSSALVEQLIGELIGLDREDAVWADRYPESHPERQRIAAATAQVEEDLATEVSRIVEQRRSEMEIARIREASLTEGIARLEEQVLDISSNALGLRQLQREADAKRQTYEAFLGRLTETRTQEQLQQPDARLIERANVPGVPSAPRPKLMGALGVMLGLAGGLGLVFFLEMTTQTFRSSRDLESETGLPVLSAIPVQPWGRLTEASAALAADPYSLYGERIRQLRTALMMRDGQATARTVLLMSCAPGDGKSTTTLALAQMAALAGKSVIVVDCDLRRATLQGAFDWEMEPGKDFAAFIRGQCSLDQAVYSDPELGIDLLAAATPDAKLADKLDPSWLTPVMEELKRVYDLVLVDAPAMLAVSDAMVLAQVVDTRVFIVRWDSTPRKAVAQGLAALDEAHLPVAGLALTMVDPSRSPDAEAEGYYSYSYTAA